MLSIFLTNFPQFLQGILTTLELVFTSAILGLLSAICLVTLKQIHSTIINKIIETYLFIIRSTPFLLQLYIIYYGSMQFHFINHSFLADIFKSAYLCALIALTLNTSAYTTIFLSHTLNSINKKEILVAKSLGFSQWQINKCIIWPQVLIKILPIYSNELIMLMKCAAIASSITILDVMGVTQQIIGLTYQTIPCLMIAGIIYLILNMLFNLPLKYIYNKHHLKLT